MWTLANVITLVRICFTPVIALLPFIEGYWPKLIAFFVFLAAAISDVYDGHLARSRNEVTDLGKMLDPVADKLLLLAGSVGRQVAFRVFVEGNALRLDGLGRPWPPQVKQVNQAIQARDSGSR